MRFRARSHRRVNVLRRLLSPDRFGWSGCSQTAAVPQNSRVALTCQPVWIDRFVMRLATLQPLLPWDLSNAVANAWFVDQGWLEPEMAGEFYAIREANRE